MLSAFSAAAMDLAFVTMIVFANFGCKSGGKSNGFDGTQMHKP